MQGLKSKSTSEPIDLNTVRLCFQAFLQSSEGKKKKFTPLEPVVSEPIRNKKGMPYYPAIVKLSHASGSAAGGQDMILLCDQVAKEDIEIVFFEKINDRVVWNSKGIFSPFGVYHQFAISFETPRYKDPHITRKVDVFIQLRRPSDGVTGDPVRFSYTPNESGYQPPRKIAKSQNPLMSPISRDFSIQNSLQTAHVNPQEQTPVQYLPIQQEPSGSGSNVNAVNAYSPAPYDPPGNLHLPPGNDCGYFPAYNTLQPQPINSLPPFEAICRKAGPLQGHQSPREIPKSQESMMHCNNQKFSNSNSPQAPFASPQQSTPVQFLPIQQEPHNGNRIDNAVLTAVNKAMEANRSLTTCNPIKPNVNQRTSDNMPAEHESAVCSLEQKLSKEELLGVNAETTHMIQDQNVNCSTCDVDELSENMSQLMYSSGSTSKSEELRTILSGVFGYFTEMN